MMRQLTWQSVQTLLNVTHLTRRSQSERVTAGSDSTTSSSGGNSGGGNVVLVDMRPAEDAEFGLDEVMVRALQEVSGVRSQDTFQFKSSTS